jgi:acetone carboxylase gamma subunit
VKEIKEATNADETLQVLKQYITREWPKYEKDVQSAVKPYYQYQAHLSVLDDIITYDNRIVIPAKLQRDMLKCLHQGHWGLSKCRDLASESIWWLGISKDIKQMISNCEECQKSRPNQSLSKP